MFIITLLWFLSPERYRAVFRCCSFDLIGIDSFFPSFGGYSSFRCGFLSTAISQSLSCTCKLRRRSSSFSKFSNSRWSLLCFHTICYGCWCQPLMNFVPVTSNFLYWLHGHHPHMPPSTRYESEYVHNRYSSDLLLSRLGIAGIPCLEFMLAWNEQFSLGETKMLTKTKTQIISEIIRISNLVYLDICFDLFSCFSSVKCQRYWISISCHMFLDCEMSICLNCTLHRKRWLNFKCYTFKPPLLYFIPKNLCYTTFLYYHTPKALCVQQHRG